MFTHNRWTNEPHSVTLDDILMMRFGSNVKLWKDASAHFFLPVGSFLLSAASLASHVWTSRSSYRTSSFQGKVKPGDLWKTQTGSDSVSWILKDSSNHQKEKKNPVQEARNDNVLFCSIIYNNTTSIQTSGCHLCGFGESSFKLEKQICSFRWLKESLRVLETPSGQKSVLMTVTLQVQPLSVLTRQLTFQLLSTSNVQNIVTFSFTFYSVHTCNFHHKQEQIHFLF